jgi:predicted Zn-dependent peptidase
MKSQKLKNGITLIQQRTPSASVVLQVMVRVGSNDEKDGIRGISHFLEHMLFEGTKKRPNSKVIASVIEDLGGEMNAYTTSECTAYHIKVLAKHFDLALDVLSDMLLNSTFEPKFIEKEKKVILKEIHMVHDDPRFYKWILFQQTMFKEHPSKHPTYGTEEDVKAMTQKTLLNFYQKYYRPDNMIVTIVGNVGDVKGKIEKSFPLPPHRTEKKSFPKEPVLTSVRSATEKKQTKSAYTVLGFLVCPRNHKDSYALDVLEAVFGRGQSGRMFDSIRNTHGLAYEVGVRNELGKDIGYMTVHTSTDPSAAEKAKQLMLEEFRRPVTQKEVADAKTFIEGNYLLQNENTEEHADELCYWEYIGDAKKADAYIKSIKKVTFADAVAVQKKYFSGNYAVAVVGPK